MISEFVLNSVIIKCIETYSDAHSNSDLPDSGSKPVDYPDWCEIIRKPDSCTSVAVMRVNHKLPCLWGRGRLRPAAGQMWKSDNDPMF